MRYKSIIVFTLLLLYLNPCYSQWVELPSPTSAELTDVYMKYGGWGIPSYGYICGKTGVYYSDDGGNSWIDEGDNVVQSDSLIFSRSQFNELTSTYANNTVYWFVVGTDTVSNQGVVFRKSDTLSWELVSIGTVGSVYSDVRFADVTGVVVGDNGLVIKTYNIGEDWEVIESLQNQDFRDVEYQPENSKFYISGSSVFTLSLWSSNNDLVLTNLPTMIDMEIEAYGDHEIFGLLGNAVLVGFPGYYIRENFKDPFNPTCIETTGPTLIGTNDGILRCIDEELYGEIYESTLGYDITSISNVDYYKSFAVTRDGRIITTDSLNKDHRPYMDISVQQGACIDSNFTFTYNGPLSTLCGWYIDDIPITNSHQLDTALSGPNTYEIRFVADNGNHRDTIIFDFETFTLPNLQTTVLVDTFLCKQGETNIILESSELNVYYELISIDGEHIDSIFGTGDSLVFGTGLINDTSFYNIFMSKGNLGCRISSEDTIEVIVENPKANFTAGIINANLNEDVIYFNNSLSSDNYYWSFSDAQPFISSDYEPIVQYNNLGLTDSVMLIAYTDNGCYDTIKKTPETFVVNNSGLSSTNWTLNNVGNTSDAAYDHEDVNAIEIDSQDNIFACGSYDMLSFSSRVGQEKYNNNFGSFVSKSDSKGVLKWVVYSVENHAPNYPANYSREGDVYDIEIDSLGNSYVVGWCGINSTFYFPDGDSINYEFVSGPPHSSEEGFMMKLSPNGRLIWLKPFPAIVTKVEVVDTFIYAMLQNSSTTYLYKYNLDGSLVWETTYSFQLPLYHEYTLDFKVDEEGNCYFIGQTTDYITVNSVNGEVDILDENYSYGARVFIIKYSSLGNYEWGHIIKGSIGVQGIFDRPTDIELDNQGNVYLLIDASTYYPTQSFELTSYSGQNESVVASSFYLASYDSDGGIRWGNGFVGITQDEPYRLCIDSQDNVYCSVKLINLENQSETYFTSFFTDSIDVEPNNGTYFLKYNNLGTLLNLYIEEFGNGIMDIRDMEFSSDNSINVCGRGNASNLDDLMYWFYDTITMYGYDGFISKLSAGFNESHENIFIQNNNSSCNGDSVIVHIPYFISQAMPDDTNSYILELSSSQGDFSTSVILDSINSELLMDTFNVVIEDTLSLGDYFVRVRSTSPILISDSIPLYIHAVPQSVTSIDSICFGDSIQLQANYNNGIWSNSLWLSDSTSSTPYTVPDSNIVYEYVTNFQCGIVRDTFSVEVIKVVIETMSDTTVCFGDTILLRANTNYPSVWSLDGFNSVIENPNEDSTLVWPFETGYFVISSSFNDLSCENSDSVLIEVSRPQPFIVIQNDSVLTTTNTFSDYQWSLNNTAIGDEESFHAFSSGWYSVLVTDSVGCMAKSDSIFFQYLSVESSVIFNDDRVELFPNPNNGIFYLNNLNLKNKTFLTLLDLQGRVVHKQDLQGITGQQHIEIPRFISGGNYLMRIVNKSFVKEIPIIIRR